MPLAPVLRGQLIRAETDAILKGDEQCEEAIHSLLLMTLSPYFDTILERCNSKVIRIEGADKEVLKIIKEYAYEGKITAITSENVDKVYKVADMYNIISLINECQLFITNNNLTELEAGGAQIDLNMDETLMDNS